jgi:hypothetical protein
MIIKDLKEAIQDLDDELLIVVRSGNSFYEVEDLDNTSLAFEIMSGEHHDFN